MESYVCLRVEFLLKTDSGYPKDTGVNKPWQPLGIYYRHICVFVSLLHQRGETLWKLMFVYEAHIYIYVDGWMLSVCLAVYRSVSVSVFLSVYVCTWAHTHTHTCMYAHTHARTCAHTHTPLLTGNSTAAMRARRVWGVLRCVAVHCSVMQCVVAM